MKKLILMLGVIFLINMESRAQLDSHFIAASDLTRSKQVSFFSATSPSPVKDYDFYMRRSKKMRTTGLVLLGSGVVLSGVGALLSFGNNDIANNSAGGVGAVLLIAGAASGITSIPFMSLALASHNKARALVDSKKTGYGVPSNVSKDIVGITLQIPLGK